MDGSAELLRQGGIVLTLRSEHVVVVWAVPICAPEALYLAGIRVDDSNAAIEVAIGHEGFLSRGVDKNFGDSAKAHRIVTVADERGIGPCSRARYPVLREHLSVLSELQDLR